MHELVHVFYPSGNRFLAEGLAVHLQEFYLAAIRHFQTLANRCMGTYSIAC